jgi:hypothetical protein
MRILRNKYGIEGLGYFLLEMAKLESVNSFSIDFSDGLEIDNDSIKELKALREF